MFGWLKRRRGREVVTASRDAVKKPPGPTAYVNCGRGIEFIGEFLVGMTLQELLEWLQVNCSFDILYGMPWLPQRLREANPEELPLDHVMQAGDIILLHDQALPAPQENKALGDK